MDWDEIIERNRGRILLAIAPLLAVLGFDQRRREEVPRCFYNDLIALLRPAESAVRRLIIIAARGIVIKLRLGASRAFPAGLGARLKIALEKGSQNESFPAFQLIDPLKRFAAAEFDLESEAGGEEQKVQILPRISVPGFIDPVFPENKPGFIPADDDPIDTSALLRRIRSLKSALDNLPRHAKRLARWKARSELAQEPGAPWKPGRLSPFRPGFAPGYQQREKRGIDMVLGDCHYFARQAWADTS